MRVQEIEHLRLVEHEHAGGAHGRRRRDALRLSRETALPEEVTLTEHRDHGLFTGAREHRQLDPAALDVEHVGRGIALREDDRRWRKASNGAPGRCRLEEGLQIE